MKNNSYNLCSCLYVQSDPAVRRTTHFRGIPKSSKLVGIHCDTVPVVRSMVGLSKKAHVAVIYVCVSFSHPLCQGRNGEKPRIFLIEDILYIL